MAFVLYAYQQVPNDCSQKKILRQGHMQFFCWTSPFLEHLTADSEAMNLVQPAGL
ncbi:MAG: hypothetical protein HY067_22230 [Betaproteobacteria bacterium]|nr:hypothetical protein [Betaproteobacteria bacterium]